MKRHLALSTFAFTALLMAMTMQVFAQEHAEPANETSSEPAAVDVSEVIMDHVIDNHVWHFTENVVIPLPVIVYSEEKGLDIFSSGNLYHHHQPVEYNGYKLDGHHIVLADSGKKVFDLSITKNVAMLFINATVLLLILLSAARSYGKNKGKAPKGTASWIEPIVLFVQNDIVKPNIGPRYEKYLPWLLTLFFFILFGNLLGLLPGAANLTGNIAVTLCMALITFVITNINGNKGYWAHIFWTPGVPLWLRPIMIMVEVIGIFTKPFALTVRLFVAITAGHIVLLALICLTFVFKSYAVGAGSTLFVVCISLIELLVAGIQAYVFTLFSALYVGMAIEEHEHETEHAH